MTRRRQRALLGLTVAMLALVGCEPEPPPVPRETDVWLNAERDDGRTLARRAHEPSFAHVRMLVVSGVPIGDAGYAALARSPYLGSLRRLNLFESDMTNLGLAALSAARDLRPASISIGVGTFDHRGWSLLLQSPILSSTTTLRIVGAPIGDTGALELSRSPQAESLVDLSVTHCGLTERGIAALFTSTRLGRLESLSLSKSGVDLSVFEHLKDPANLPRLSELLWTHPRLPPGLEAAIEAARPGLDVRQPVRRRSPPAPTDGVSPAGGRPDAAPSSPSPRPAPPAGGTTSRPDPPPRRD